MVTHFSRVKVHELLITDAYELFGEEYTRGQDTFLLLHLSFRKWTPSVFRRFMTHWEMFRSCVTAPLFATGEVDDDKFERFVTHLGFKYHDTVHCDNGESRRLFIT